MKKDLTVFLKHILESTSRIENYLQGVNEDSFYASTEKQDMVVRRLEIIGEATKNLPNEFREKYPEVAWKDMAGMRDVIVHQYFDINYKRVWDTAKNFLPPLKMKIQEILEKEEKKS